MFSPEKLPHKFIMCDADCAFEYIFKILNYSSSVILLHLTLLSSLMTVKTSAATQSQKLVYWDPPQLHNNAIATD